MLHTLVIKITLLSLPISALREREREEKEKKKEKGAENVFAIGVCSFLCSFVFSIRSPFSE